MIISSSVPIVVAVVLIGYYIIGRTLRKWSSGHSSQMSSDLTYRLLLLGYLVLPSVSLKQLQALDCIEIANRSYLRIDTSILYDSEHFRFFRFVDGLFIVAYLATPLVWLSLLLSRRRSLDPARTTGSDKRLALFLRDQDQNLRPLYFLFCAYRPNPFFMEVVEM